MTPPSRSASGTGPLGSGRLVRRLKVHFAITLPASDHGIVGRWTLSTSTGSGLFSPMLAAAGRLSFWVGSSVRVWHLAPPDRSLVDLLYRRGLGRAGIRCIIRCAGVLPTARLRGLPCRLGFCLDAGAASHCGAVLRRCAGA